MSINGINPSEDSKFIAIKPPAQKNELETVLNNLSNEDKQKILAKANGMLDKEDQSAKGEVLDKLSNSDIRKLISEAKQLAQKENGTDEKSNNIDDSKISLTNEDKNEIKANAQNDLEKLSQNEEVNKTKSQEIRNLIDYIDYMDNNNYDIKYDTNTNTLESVNNQA